MSNGQDANRHLYEWAHTLGEKSANRISTFDQMWLSLNESLEQAVAGANSALHNNPASTLILTQNSDGLAIESALNRHASIQRDTDTKTLLMKSSWGDFQLHYSNGQLEIRLDCDPLPYMDDFGSVPPMMDAAMRDGTCNIQEFVKATIEEMLGTTA